MSLTNVISIPCLLIPFYRIVIEGMLAEDKVGDATELFCLYPGFCDSFIAMWDAYTAQAIPDSKSFRILSHIFQLTCLSSKAYAEV